MLMIFPFQKNTDILPFTVVQGPIFLCNLTIQTYKWFNPNYKNGSHTSIKCLKGQWATTSQYRLTTPWHSFYWCLNSIGGMYQHTSTKNSIIWCFVNGGGKRCLRCSSRISHKCSIGLKSGDRRPLHMVYIIFLLIITFGDHTSPVDGGIVILWEQSNGSQNNGQNNGLPSIIIHDPNHVILIA
jgi:hypothetical protein